MRSAKKSPTSDDTADQAAQRSAAITPSRWRYLGSAAILAGGAVVAGIAQLVATVLLIFALGPISSDIGKQFGGESLPPELRSVGRLEVSESEDSVDALPPTMTLRTPGMYGIYLRYAGESDLMIPDDLEPAARAGVLHRKGKQLANAPDPEFASRADLSCSVTRVRSETPLALTRDDGTQEAWVYFHESEDREVRQISFRRLHAFTVEESGDYFIQAAWLGARPRPETTVLVATYDEEYAQLMRLEFWMNASLLSGWGIALVVWMFGILDWIRTMARRRRAHAVLRDSPIAGS